MTAITLPAEYSPEHIANFVSSVTREVYRRLDKGELRREDRVGGDVPVLSLLISELEQ